MSIKKRPAYRVYTVEDIDDEKSFWTMVGVAFAHEDKKGMNILLKALPIDGRLVLRRFTEITPDKMAAVKTVANKKALAKVS